MNSTSEKRVDGLMGGLILIAVGAVFLLLQQGILRMAGIWDWWPLIVVAMGLGKLVSGGAKRRRDGLWLLFVGGWLLANTQHLFGLNWQNSWPVMVIGLGMLLSLGALFPVGRRGCAEADNGN
jgi:hypothetical protein